MKARCIHFGVCGGCTLQDLPEDAYRTRKRDAVARALKRNGLDGSSVTDIVEVPPATRRRAVFKIAKRSGAVALGFHALRSHTVVDMHECLVLTPKLLALASRLRALMSDVLANGQNAEAHVSEADNGIDVAFRANVLLKPALARTIADAASEMDVIRVLWNGALAFESTAPTVRFGKAVTNLPPHAFLQPTREGEALLLSMLLVATRGAKSVADLFCGCGTFSLPLAERGRVHAVEKDAAMLDAVLAAARTTQGLKPVTGARRDLFKAPLTAEELGKFEAVALDPPRAGAGAQVSQLAKSKVSRVAYVSCNAGSFARDARILVDGGFRMGTVTPVDQFLWSEHIELFAPFAR